MASALSAGVTGYIALRVAHKNVYEQAKLQVISVEESRTAALGAYLDSIKEDLSALAYSPYVHQALHDFSGAWSEMAFNQTMRLQRQYINQDGEDGKNMFPIGEKEKYDGPENGTAYDRYHREYHPWFRHFLQTKGYYDIFLIDPRGDVVYTVFKEMDFASNVVDGEWKDTDLGKMFREVRDHPQKDFQFFTDFAAYKPSHDIPAGFIGQPILNEDGSLAGVLAFQMPIGRIDHIMQLSTGMGETGQTYVVGSDRKLRSDPRPLKDGEESLILKAEVSEDAVQEAIVEDEEHAEALRHSSLEDVHPIKNYKGEAVISAFGAVDFLGTRWVVLAEKGLGEVMAPIRHMENVVFGLTLIIIVVVVLVGFVISRQISRPISALAATMSKMAEGKLDVLIPSLDAHDEIGEMAQAVNVLKESGVEAERLREENKKAEERAKNERGLLMKELAGKIDTQVGSAIKALLGSAEKLQEASRAMQATAQQTTDASTSVAGASEETSVNVNTVASATEEMTASAQEISRQVANVAQKASYAAGSASRTSEQVHDLHGLVENIGEVVYAIKDIAEQTNLLALNATIEAARAGEAGKGFAVVADEVKKLASETAQKTEEIETRITEIQAATEASVQAMQEIIDGVSDIDGLSAGAAGAVEEQNAVIAEITRNIAEVSQAAQEVASVIGRVQAAASETGEVSALVNASAEEITILSSDLEKTVRDVITQIKEG